MMIRVKRVRYAGEYKLKILFSNEITKIVDFTKWINEGGVYAIPLRDLEYFKKVKLDEFHYSICWPNGADFSPDALYENGVVVKELKRQVKPKSKLNKSSHVSYKAAAFCLTKKGSKKVKMA